MAIRKFDASVKEIRAILRSEGLLYAVPRYQRGFAWTRSQIQSLWNDILEEKFPGMFIGTILLNHGEIVEERVEIIDGQQRILTVTIMLSVIRDKLFSLGDHRGAHDVHTFYIAAAPYIGADDEPKVIPGPKIGKFFGKRIQDYPLDEDSVIPKPSNDEESRVNSARNFFNKSINDILKEIEHEVEQIAWLRDMSKKIEKLTVVAIDVEDEQDAYTVFESVNAKGASLTLADILKNMIFRKIPKTGEVDVAQIQWDQILKNLEDCPGFTMSKFVRYHWLSKYDFLTESKLYEAIKHELNNKKSITWQELLDNLVNESRRLKILIGANSEDYSQFKSPRRVSQSLDGMSKMGVTQVYVLLLSMHRNFAMKEKWKGDYEFLEKFCFNYHTISKLQAVRVERKYSKYARLIEDLNNQDLTPKKRQKNLEKILSGMRKDLVDLKEEFVTRENFIERFTVEVEYSTNKKKKDLLRYVLLRIDGQIAEGTGELMVDPQMTNLEHILPRKPEKWGLEEGEVSDYVNHVGNLTILSKKLNSSVGNKPLVEKLSEYRDSELSINGELVAFIEDHNSEWNEEIIQLRGIKLAELAYDKIWNI